MQHTFPVMKILLAERNIESIGLPGGMHVGGGRAFGQQLQNGVVGNEMDQEKNQRDYEPYYRQRVQHAKEEVAEHSVLGTTKVVPLPTFLDGAAIKSMNHSLNDSPSPLPAPCVPVPVSRSSPWRCGGLPSLRRYNDGLRNRKPRRAWGFSATGRAQNRRGFRSRRHAAARAGIASRDRGC